MRSAALDAALAEADAAAFVHVGSPGGPTIRFLSGASLPCAAGVVYDGAVTLVPERALPDEAAVDDDVTVRDPSSNPGERVADLVSGRVLTPRTIPHDAALYLERSGVGVASTDAHLRARERKTGAELAAIEDAQAAAESGVAAAASLLAGAGVEGSTTNDDNSIASETLADGDGPVTAERVRRATNAAMASAGANPAGNTVVVGGDAPSTRDSPLPASDPVAVRVAPRVQGHHGLLARTFVADSDGGWERRATLACERAIDAGVGFVDPGETTAEAAAGEVTAELGSYGFPPAVASGGVHGVGLERRERPVGEDVLEPGAVVALEPTLDGDGGDGAVVWLADLAVVTENGAELLGSFPRSVVPRSAVSESD